MKVGSALWVQHTPEGRLQRTVLAEPEPITQILAHIGEPTSPPLTHPARGPPQADLDMGAARGEAEEVAQESFPDDRLGSIEEGEVANLLITTGSPIESTSRVETMFIRGEKVPWDDKFNRLFRRYGGRSGGTHP